MSTNKSFSNETSERYSRALFEVANENSEINKIENNQRGNVEVIYKNEEDWEEIDSN